MSALDLAIAVIIMLIAVNAVQAETLRGVQRRADIINEMLHDCRTEADAARARLHGKTSH